jgi:hypothetical protein
MSEYNDQGALSKSPIAWFSLCSRLTLDITDRWSVLRCSLTFASIQGDSLPGGTLEIPESTLGSAGVCVPA